MNLDGSTTMVKERWQSISQNQKIIAVLVAIGVVACFIYLVLVALRPAYAPLVSGLDPKEAGTITEELSALGIPYQLTEQGQTIQVPEGQIYDTRIQLASNGLLGGDGKGFELFDQSKFGQSDFDQQVNYQRALQEELRRTILHIDGVQDARVHLVLPEKSLFITEQGVATASVALTLAPAVQLKNVQIQGIANLLIGSVEGLTPENIHIIDNAGNILSEDLQLSSDPDVVLSKATLEQQRLQREYEKELEIRVRQMLTKITGQNNSVAMVTADLDFSKQQVTSVTNTNPNNVKISEHNLAESGRGNDIGAPVGTDSNITTTPFAQSINSSSYTKDENTINYQVSSTEELTVAAPGRVRRLSAAVVINDNPANVSDVGKIKDAVAAAIGYDEERGDQISVTSMAFDDSYQKSLEAEAAQAEQEKMQNRFYILIALAGLILLLLLVLLITYLLRRRKREEEFLSEELVEMEQVEQPLVVEELEEEELQRDNKKDRLRKMAGESPNDIAEIIKLWLRD